MREMECKQEGRYGVNDNSMGSLFSFLVRFVDPPGIGKAFF
jgi:hypothetical protein